MLTIDAAALYAALDDVRTDRGWTWSRLAAEAGVSPSMMTRLGQGP